MEDLHGPAIYLWLSTGGAAGSLWALYKFIASIRRDRIVEDTPLVRIRSAAQGYVKVYGLAKQPQQEETRAPLSSRPCVWWTYKVEERDTNSRKEDEWRSIDSGTCIVPFVLADADAECLVGPVNAEITPTSHNIWYGDLPRPDGLYPKSDFGPVRRFRYSESILSPGDRLSVLGELRSHSEVSAAAGAAAALLKLWKNDQASLLARFDSNHDGHIDAAEWDVARRAAEVESQANSLGSAIARTSVIAQPTNGEPFIIAAMDSDGVVRREKLRALLYLVFGLSCVALCGWAIAQLKALAGLPAP